jgi:hypothetical protein
MAEKHGLSRLEDLIALAREGEKVLAEVTLRKQLVTQKVHPEETEEMRPDVNMYLLIGDYTFKVGKDVKQVSKVYLYGSAEESMTAAKVDTNIANERLKMDYRRLRAANISFEEKYF